MCALMDDLASEDRTALTDALADPAFTNAAIVRALRAEGHEFGYTTVARHRKGECRG